MYVELRRRCVNGTQWRVLLPDKHARIYEARMSDLNREQRIDKLMSEARSSKSAHRLWCIALELEQISAWVEAREVERLAEKAGQTREEKALL
jgi:hypothetical protein